MPCASIAINEFNMQNYILILNGSLLCKIIVPGRFKIRAKQWFLCPSKNHFLF